jgi:hypothetical protein
MKFNRDIFKSKYEKAFGVAVPPTLSSLLDKIEQDGRLLPDLRKIAYFLATIKWETANTFSPIKERRARPGTAVRTLQDRYWGTGYYGRGYIQLTFRKNYARFGIEDAPDKALEPDTAYEIASKGMTEGLFTGKKLGDYFSANSEDFIGARKIINGTDKASEIALIARKIQACLSLSLSSEPETVSPAAETSEPISASGIVEKLKSAASTYQAADGSIKNVVGRITQVIWTVVLGALSFLESHPLQVGITIGVLLLGYLAINQYCRWQTTKMAIKLTNKG